MKHEAGHGISAGPISPIPVTPPLSAIDQLLRQRLIVCLGSGGVGKTTVAAALGLAAARRQGDTAVITVDPARRLTDTLGLASLSTDPQRVPLDDGAGRLDAMALDTKRVFDALISRVAPSPEVARRIHANRLYRELSDQLGGSTEYMAMEKLYDLLHQDAYRLIVVDTPPSVHARDLLSAPLRLTAVLASSAVRILKTPSSLLRGGDTRFGRVTMRALLTALERWTGMELLSDVSDFAASFEHLVDGFRARAHDVDQALRRDDTSFVLVTTPERNTVAATVDFDRELRREGFPVAGIIANRVHDFPDFGDEAGAAYPPRLRHKLLANYADFVELARRDRAAIDRLSEAAAAPVLATLPALEETPASPTGLRRFAELLVAATHC